MDVTVEREQPVTPPVTSVTMVLTLEEAQLLKLVTNYRPRVVKTIREGSGQEVVTLGPFLYALHKLLDKGGIHARDRKVS